MAEAVQSPRFRHDVYALSAVFFFVFMGAGAQQAYLIPYLTQVAGWSAVRGSLLLACVYVSMLLFRVGNLRLFPTWTDRRYTIVGSLTYCLFTVFMAAMAVAPWYPLALAAAALWGCGAAMMWTGTSMQVMRLSDLAGGRHGTGMGILYMSTQAGWLCGAILLGRLYRSLATGNLALLYVTAAAVTLVGCLTALTLPATGTPVRHLPTWGALAEIMRRERAQIAGALQFLSALAYGLILGVFGRYVKERYGSEWLWITVSLYPATQMVLALAGGRLGDRLGHGPVLVAAFLTGTAGLALAAAAPSVAVAAVLAVSLGALNSTVSVTASALVGKAASSERRPMVYGLVFAWRDLGITTASVGANLLGLRFEAETVFAIFAVVFAACAGLSALLGRYTDQHL